MCALLSACPNAGSETEGETGATETSAAATAVDPTMGEPVGPGELKALVLPMLWMPVAADADPLAMHRPEAVTCPLGAWLFDAEGIEVNTQTCNYGSFVQPSKVEIVPGARIVGSLYHFDLLAAEPATAHVALLVGEVLVWEQEIAIPGKANAFTIDLPASFAAPAGTPVNFHLHNHGQNNWHLGALQVEVFP